MEYTYVTEHMAETEDVVNQMCEHREPSLSLALPRACKSQAFYGDAFERKARRSFCFVQGV
jgi:hypothetical protein